MKLVIYYKYDENKKHTQEFSHCKVFKKLNGQHLKEAHKTNTYIKDIETLNIKSKTELTNEVKRIEKILKEKMSKVTKAIECEETEVVTKFGIYEDEDNLETISIDVWVDDELEITVDEETDLNKWYIIGELYNKFKTKKEFSGWYTC